MAAAAPMHQEWAEVLEAEDEELLPPRKAGQGSVCQITPEVYQDPEDSSVFRVDGKDKSWFMQKGGIMFDHPDAARLRLRVRFLGDAVNRYGEDYAELSRAEQHATINWLLMLGVAPRGYELTGYRDCKAGGFYFLLHLDYRRTCWRVAACPHCAELEDAEGTPYPCDPRDRGRYELPAHEGQALFLELAGQDLWLSEAGERRLRGRWPPAAGPAADLRPVLLLPNCPTALEATLA
mmetsp:Transcript_7328/g.22955  ORF Transcript_7328/g.22955 Transcript_7328/m.22955 type:complete len:236 (-) Transcript_7328:84-791(-)